MKKVDSLAYIVGLVVVINLIGHASQTYPALTALAAFGIGIAVANINKLK